MNDKVCNVFISHVHEDDSRLQLLKDLLAENGCSARDSSVNSTKPNNASDPDYIKREVLAPRIAWAGTVVVLITPDTKDSPSVNWEIEYAHNWESASSACGITAKRMRASQGARRVRERCRPVARGSNHQCHLWPHRGVAGS